jgi:nitrogen-specific signal transduction histidine kinase
MAALPSRPGSACVGRERLAVDRSYATGELAALPADPEAAGTTKADDTPGRVLSPRGLGWLRGNRRVLVSADYDGQQWRIDVADASIGIPPAEAGQLFSRFVRASNARTAGLPGTGLGLSIVKVLTEMHGGHVEVDSTLGRGSTFSVYLPGDGL